MKPRQAALCLWKPRGLPVLAMLAVWLATAGATFSPQAMAKALDPSFSGDGRVTTNFGGEDSAHAVTIQGDGRIVAAGVTIPPPDSVPPPAFWPNEDFAVARYGPKGTLDSGFSGDGKQTTDFAHQELAADVAIQDDGKIVVAGSEGPSEGSDFALARYNLDGTLDRSFSGDGKQTTDFGEAESGNAIAIQDDGKIVVAGVTACIEFDPPYDCSADVADSRDDFALARYHPDGSLDHSFAGDGKQTTDFGVPLRPTSTSDEGLAVALQDDGKIVVAGESNLDFAVARYLPNGTLDPSFALTGRQTTDFAGEVDSGEDLVIQDDGRIVVGGFTWKDDHDFALARYTPLGTLDPSFAGDGKQTTDLGQFDFAEGVGLLDDGTIVLAGATRTRDVPYDPDFALVRYRTDGTRAGAVVTQFGRRPSLGWDVAVQDDDRIVVAGVLGAPGKRDFGLARYNLDSCAGRSATITGTPRDDTLTGTPRPDVIVARSGNDRVGGRGRGDVICGGLGRDKLGGGAGADDLFGGRGADELVGGKGQDRCRGGRGEDTLRGCEA